MRILIKVSKRAKVAHIFDDFESLRVMSSLGGMVGQIGQGLVDRMESKLVGYEFGYTLCGRKYGPEGLEVDVTDGVPMCQRCSQVLEYEVKVRNQMVESVRALHPNLTPEEDEALERWREG